MKNLFYLLSIMLIAFSFNSCTGDSEEIEIVKTSLFKNKKVNEFLTNYYNVNYTIGESIVSEGHNIKITSLFSSSQNDPIGYVFTEFNSEKFISFLDINFELQESKMFDFINDKELINDDFFKSNSLNKEQGFNLVSEIQENNLFEQKKFWGNSCTTHHYPWGDMEWCCYYVFWINTGCDYQ